MQYKSIYTYLFTTMSLYPSNAVNEYFLFAALHYGFQLVLHVAEY